jgi:hypothetical protein
MHGCYTARGSGQFVVRQPACRVARARGAPAANMGVVGLFSSYAKSTKESLPVGAAKDNMMLWFHRPFCKTPLCLPQRYSYSKLAITRIHGQVTCQSFRLSTCHRVSNLIHGLLLIGQREVSHANGMDGLDPEVGAAYGSRMPARRLGLGAATPASSIAHWHDHSET